MEANILSDGEISNDSDENDRYSVISSGEDEYFKNLTNEIKSRQAELELENVLQGYVDDYAKENRFKKNKHPTKRSFRASSVLTNYSLPKRKRSYRQQKKKKHTRGSNKKSNDSKNIETMKIEDSGDDEDDCELIALRIKALKSKQELKECSTAKQEPPEQKKEREPEEEELLRIDALRSALLKKKDHFMEKKRKRKLEKERPYSPTDDLDKILDVDTCQMDMEISTASNSPRCNDQTDTNHEEIHLMDMELVSSPIRTINDNDNDEDEEEKALRSMLLSSISDKRKAEEKSVAMNLKLAVERLRQAQHKQQTSSPQVPTRLQASKKSGTKTIKMILEEKKFRKVEVDSEFQAQIEAENVLLNKITSEQNEVIEKLPTPLIEEAAENNILLSTISDTKNIPLLSKEPANDVSDRKRNRVLTSVIKYPVKPLIIKVNTESSDEDATTEEVNRNSKTVKKTHRKIINLSNTQQQQQIDVIEKQVESLLRKIRLQSEIQPKISTATATVQNAASSLAVNHLPRSAQIEYAMLMEKMRVLEETKIMRQKLKRQKSSAKIENENIKKETSNPAISLKKKFATEKIEDTLSKIQFLGEEARERFASNAENKYLAHTTSLKTTTEDLIKLVRANSFDILRRQKVDAKIVELEKQLLKFRTMKKVIEQRINTGIPQIIRSQMALIKLRNHQHNFGNMCLRVGEIVRGPEYSLPDNHIQEIQKNLSHIVEECSEIQKACSEHFAIKHLSHNSQKIKEFISTSNLNDNDAMIGDENIGANKAIDNDVSGRKRILGLDSSTTYSNMITKKIKYESPLEYARSEKSDEDVNRVVCPNTLRSSSCQDSACKMLHI